MAQKTGVNTATEETRDAKIQRWKVLTAFILVYSCMNGLTLLAIVDAFNTPKAAGLILMLRTIPSFFVGWLTGFAADYHKTRTLAWIMIAITAGVFFIPYSTALFFAGLVVAWVEVSMGALLAEQRKLSPKSSAVAIGYGYDIAKLASVGLAFLLAQSFGKWVLAVLAVAGAFLFRNAYLSRAKSEQVSFTWKLNVVIPTIMVFIAGFGVNNLLWIQGEANRELKFFLYAGAAFAVGAIVGNTTVLLLKRGTGYPLGVLGLVGMTAAVTVLALNQDDRVSLGMLCIIWFVFGWGAATAWQSARTVLLGSEANGRDMALFSMSGKVSIAAGGIFLSFVIPHQYILIVTTGVLSILVLGYGWLRNLHREETRQT